MTLKFSAALTQRPRLRMPSAGFWLRVGAGAVVIWTLMHGGITLAPETGAAPASESGAGSGATHGTTPAAPATVTGSAAPAGAPAAPVKTPDAARTPSASSAQFAAAPGLAGAQLALSTIDVMVRRNDTLDQIFRRLRLDLSDLASLRSLPAVRASLDSLHPGELLHFKHRNGLLFGLERRLNESQTLKVSRDPAAGLKADVLQNPIETRVRTVRGIIDTSLFEAVSAAGAHEQTAVQLADIFSWDVDFVLDVRPGDAFAVTYPEIWRDGSYVKDGPIQAALFINQGREYRAVRYVDPEGSSHYYSPDGRSLHKAFLRAPVDFTRVSSRFNSARRHPILNRIRAHKGVDYAAPTGTPVRAAGDGRVRFVGRMGGYGNLVEIEHSSSVVTVYGHLSRFARGTRPGAHVTQGTVIAYVGQTGLATGPHLHYEYRVNGVFKNPQTVALPSAAPLDARWREDFLARSAPLLGSLNDPPGAMLVSR
jgi:murein DD-endopeptidase MepM/ murein hydrolase activator NlpD